MVSISFTWQYQEVPADDPDGEYAALAQWERLKFNLSYTRAAVATKAPVAGKWPDVDTDPDVLAAMRTLEEHERRWGELAAARRERDNAERLAAGGGPCTDCGVIVMPKDRFCRGCGVKLAAA